MSDLLWGTLKHAWPSITWTVLSGPDAGLVGLGLWGNLEPWLYLVEQSDTVQLSLGLAEVRVG